VATRRKKVGACAYCGKERDLTRDHVIPKCLFIKPRPRPIIVWACERCNNEKSKTDDYLRDLLVTDAFASESPVAQELLRGSVMRSVKQNSSAFTKKLLRDAKPSSFFAPGGIYLGEVFSVSIDGTKIFEWIIRGLYFKVTNTVIPMTYRFHVERLDPRHGLKGIEVALEMPYYARFRVGRSQEFFASLGVSDQDPFTTFWLFCFYSSIWIFAETLPKS
jgi:hypothetical protein